MIGRLSLTWLWPILCLLALPNAQARATRPAENIPVVFAHGSASENQAAHDFGIHFGSSRSFRRFESRSAPDDTSVGRWLFKIEIGRDENNFYSLIGSQAPLGLASGWQFLWRTALSPRAPSFVS